MPLLPLYIFEAKMSILLRLAMNPEGAELLFDNRIFEVLGCCQFMSVKVQSNNELIERYQRLIMPTLKVIAAILSVYGNKNNKVILKVTTSNTKIGILFYSFIFIGSNMD